MRRTPSVAERVLWKLLRGRQLEGCKFRRQVPVGPYIADFVCFEHRLIVEADSALHDNSEIITRPENVLMAILDAIPRSEPTDALRPLR